jgi:23S rRNA pseudouridine2457 synthase
MQKSPYRDRRAAPSNPFRPRRDKAYLAFNKPYEVLSQFTTSPESGKRTLADFGFPAGVYPVGRLDYDSEGLLLLSDDPVLNETLLSPAQRHPRSYLVQVENLPTEGALGNLRDGVMVQDRKTLPAEVKLLAEEPDIFPRPVPIRFRKAIPTAWLRLTLTEGRNRQVRRMTAAVGCPTLRLVRVAIGGLELDDLELAPGEWRPLTPQELLLALQ